MNQGGYYNGNCNRIILYSFKVDGLQLSVMTMAPDCAPIGIVQISHGMCEHKERYIPVMEFLASKGFACIIHDHRGHGCTI